MSLPAVHAKYFTCFFFFVKLWRCCHWLVCRTNAKVLVILYYFWIPPLIRACPRLFLHISLCSTYLVQPPKPFETVGAMWAAENSCNMQESTWNVSRWFLFRWCNLLNNKHMKSSGFWKLLVIAEKWEEGMREWGKDCLFKLHFCLTYFFSQIRNKLKDAADNIGLPTFVVADAGRTQV